MNNFRAVIKVVFLVLVVIYATLRTYENLALKKCEEDDFTPSESYGLSAENFEAVTFVRNYDADTLTVNIPAVPNVLGYHMPIRVAHVDSPEINSTKECDRDIAVKGRDYVAKLLSSAKQIDLVSVKRDKYFRLLANVRVDGLWLHELLQEQNLAIPYEGGLKPKINWCVIPVKTIK